MAVKLYLIPGHGQGDSGAVGGSYTEADLVRRLASRIKELGGDEVATSDFSLNCYANSGMLNWNFPDGAQIVELHMDSAGAGARGAHVIYKAGYTPDSYDTALAARLSSMLPGRANSLVGRSDLKDVNQAAIRGVPYRLVEHGFISDEHDRQYFIDHMDEIAHVYLEVFGIEENGDDGMTTEQMAQLAQMAAQATNEYTFGSDGEPTHGPDGNAFANGYNVLRWVYAAVQELAESVQRIEDRLDEME